MSGPRRAEISLDYLGDSQIQCQSPGQTHAQRRGTQRGRVTTEAGMGAMLSPAEEHWGLPAAAEDEGQSPQHLQRGQGLLAPGYRTSGLQSCGLKPLGLYNLLW